MPRLRVRYFVLLFLLVGCRKSARVYVSNEDSGDITVIDAAHENVVATIPVGKRPRGMRLSPDGKTLYVALSGSPKGGPGVDESKLPPADRAADGIGVVDVAQESGGKLLRVLPSGQDPESFDLTPDGRFLFVSNEETAETSVIDIGAGKIVAKIPVGAEPEGVTTRPDGREVYVTSEETSTVSVVDVAARKVVAAIPVGPRPRAIAFTGDGRRAFVSAENGSSVTIIDVEKRAVAGTIKLPGARPMGLALAGQTLYVSNGRTGSVTLVDAARGEVMQTIDTVAARPWGIDVMPDGSKAFVAGGSSDDVAVIDTGSRTVKKHIHAGKSPWGVVVGKR